MADESKCVIIKFVNDSNYSVGFQSWLKNKTITSQELKQYIDDKTEVEYYWPMTHDQKTVEITSARNITRILSTKSKRVKLTEFAVNIVDLGTWQEMHEKLKTLTKTEDDKCDKESRKDRKRKVDNDYVTDAKPRTPKKRKENNETGTPTDKAKLTKTAIGTLQKVANKNLMSSEAFAGPSDKEANAFIVQEEVQKTEIQRLKKEIDELKEKKLEEEKKNEKYRNENKFLEDEMQNLKAKNSTYEAEVSALNIKIKELENIIHDGSEDECLKKNFENLQESYTKIDEDLEKSENVIKDLEQKMKHLEEENLKYGKANDRFEERMSDYELQMREKENSENSYRKSIMLEFLNLKSALRRFEKVLGGTQLDSETITLDSRSNSPIPCSKLEKISTNSKIKEEKKTLEVDVAEVKVEKSCTNWPKLCLGRSWKTHDLQKKKGKYYILGGKLQINYDNISKARAKSASVKEFTYGLLDACFEKTELAGGSLTGNASNSQQEPGKSKKAQLDPVRIEAIFAEINEVFGKSETTAKSARNAVTSKCNNASSVALRKKKNNEDN